ncbi:hypothetical protein [Streptomyces sp. NPDC058985]|uniref:hypothetical protein n=1 Tax=Streptomyces sp. NPDC058985 TaxID=3346684 RepID=UPI003687C64D
MTIPSLTPDAVLTKLETVKRWAETEAGRHESLAAWTVSRLDDGSLFLSARVRGREPGRALHRFADRQAGYLANRPHTPGDQLPTLDVSQAGREAVLWRTGGVWVELWHPDTVTVLPATPAAPSPALAPPAPATAPAVPRRSLLSRASARLPYTRRAATKETSR